MSNISDFFPTPSGGSSSTDIFTSDVFADIVIVAGGGGAAQSDSSSCRSNCPGCGCYRWGGGGGGGIYRVRYGLNCDQTYPITVGAGGAGGDPTATVGTSQGENGSPSKFDGSRFVALGGGGAGSVQRTIIPAFCPTACPRGCQTFGKAGGQGGNSIGYSDSAWESPGASFGSQYGYHYGNGMMIIRGQICPTATGVPDIATRPLNGYDLSGSSACDTFARIGWFCGNQPLCPTGTPHPSATCSYSTGQANSGDGAGNCNGSATGGSGFVVVSYPNLHRAAPARPGSNDCSACTPGFYTYVFTSSGSITL